MISWRYGNHPLHSVFVFLGNRWINEIYERQLGAISPEEAAQWIQAFQEAALKVHTGQYELLYCSSLVTHNNE